MSLLSTIIKIQHRAAIGRFLLFHPTNQALTSASVRERLFSSRNVLFSSPWTRKKFLPSHTGRKFSSNKKLDQKASSWWARIQCTMQGWKERVSIITVLTHLAGWCAGSSLLLPPLDVVYTYFRNKYRERELAQAFLAGSVPEVDLHHLIDRPGIQAQIARILRPPLGYSSYRMIVGYHGTGKTTLVRHVGHQIPGVIYVDVLANKTSEEAFAQSFAKAIMWSPPRRSWITTILEKLDIPSDDSIARDSFFNTIFDEFCHQATLYRNNNSGHSPVLVIDNVNRLAARNPVLLEYLQDMAKDAADNRHFITVFVTSEGHAPLQLLGRSAASRLGPTITVGDLNRDEVEDLVCKKYLKTSNQAQEIYDLVGGRIKLIQSIMSELEDGITWAEVRGSILHQAKDTFSKAKLREDTVFCSVGLKIAKIIVKDGRIHVDDFFKIAGSYEQYVLLLSSNIFATVPRSDWITFQSKPVELVAVELIGQGKKGILGVCNYFT